MTWGRDTDADEAAAQLRTFAEAGGTLIDTADVYTGGDAERLLGRLMRDSVPRTELVIVHQGRADAAGPQAARRLQAAPDRRHRRLADPARRRRGRPVAAARLRPRRPAGGDPGRAGRDRRPRAGPPTRASATTRAGSSRPRPWPAGDPRPGPDRRRPGRILRCWPGMPSASCCPPPSTSARACWPGRRSAGASSTGKYRTGIPADSRAATAALRRVRPPLPRRAQPPGGGVGDDRGRRARRLAAGGGACPGCATSRRVPRPSSAPARSPSSRASLLAEDIVLPIEIREALDDVSSPD